ncbi:putative PH domain-containing protein PB16A4.02c [Tolypocladium ophioglossoides CBS 100239]|uniref:Putative PH domain-containing protein PB16A4.02c n=1 Tax=Tolypocladium ophioglossoides (strain CBS 100239) TaxID=1163406 RepID=A0A0L0NEX2_TOLOC|nr:putative PH domain-containing protein PB16A4.02c [Tolypocladium ophioglossoides CBS 100239]
MAGTQAIDVAPRQSMTIHDMRDVASPLSRSRPNLEGLAASVNQNGCFEFDRVIKSGYVEKRTQKTKKWKPVYIVLRPNTLSLYKNEKETKLRHQVHLSDLTAVALLKDPKHKRENVFGLFSPSKNFHLQAPTAKDAEEWVELIRKDARIEEEEEEMFLASPLARSLSPTGLMAVGPGRFRRRDSDRMFSSSPETYGPPAPGFIPTGRRASSTADWSGMSGNELPSHSDLSDNEGHGQRPHGASIESLAVQSPIEVGSIPRGGLAARPLANRSASQVSIINTNVNVEQDPDRVIWQGWLWMFRSKRGVRQWKDMWGVLRPRNLILYKDESEYTAQWIVQLSAVVNVVDIDPLSKSKENCLQIITEEKSYRFCTHDEESLVQFIGAFKSLLAKRRGLEARAAAPP